jgi:hypothetical protein
MEFDLSAFAAGWGEVRIDKAHRTFIDVRRLNVEVKVMI